MLQSITYLYEYQHLIPISKSHEWKFSSWFPFQILGMGFIIIDFSAKTFFSIQAQVGQIGKSNINKTSQELGNCPMGQREAFLKERIYWKKSFIEEETIGKNLEILTKFGNFVEIVKFGQNCELWSKFWNVGQRKALLRTRKSKIKIWSKF